MPHQLANIPSHTFTMTLRIYYLSVHLKFYAKTNPFRGTYHAVNQ